MEGTVDDRKAVCLSCYGVWFLWKIKPQEIAEQRAADKMKVIILDEYRDFSLELYGIMQ